MPPPSSPSGPQESSDVLGPLLRVLSALFLAAHKRLRGFPTRPGKKITRVGASTGKLHSLHVKASAKIPKLTMRRQIFGLFSSQIEQLCYFFETPPKASGFIGHRAGHSVLKSLLLHTFCQKKDESEKRIIPFIAIGCAKVEWLQHEYLRRKNLCASSSNKK
jgi:hypothetical protein